MTDPRITAIAERLRLTIPPPVPRKPKPRKSWAGLKVGDHLLDERAVTWEVVKCTSEGVTLNALGGTMTTLLHDKGWKTTFTKVRKRRTRA